MSSLQSAGSTGGGAGEDDVNVMAAKLQSLLCIPPIHKSNVLVQRNENGPRYQAPFPITSDRQKVNTTNEMKLQAKDNSRGASRVFVGEQRVVASGSYAINTEELFKSSASHKSLSGANVLTLEALEAVDVPSESQVVIMRRSHNPPPCQAGHEVTNAQANNRRHMNDYDSKRGGVKSKGRSVSPLRELFLKPDCPIDLVEDIKLFIDCSLDEHKPSNVLRLNDRLVNILKHHHIEPLKKRNLKYPKAKYWCRICNYHLDTIYAIVTHIMHIRHYKNAHKIEISEVLECIPAPSSTHQSALTDEINLVVEDCGLSTFEICERHRIVDRLNEIAQLNGIGCIFTLFGSSTSGFGFSFSDVNINLRVSNRTDLTQPVDGAEQADILNQVCLALKTLPFCTNVTESFSAKLVAIKFSDTYTEKKCVIHVNNASGVKLAQLFHQYDMCDGRVRPVLTMFRHFAKVAQIDDQNEGTLPSHCYNILALHFLQVVDVVPILHQLIQTEPDESGLSNFATAKEAALVWRTSNSDSVGLLWIKLLKYYSTEFLAREEVVSILERSLYRKSDNVWNRKLSIQDPILPRSNLSRSLCSNKICDYIIDRIRIAYLYFGVPRTKTGALYNGVVSWKEVDPSKVFYYENPSDSKTDDAWRTEKHSARMIHSKDSLGRNIKLVIHEDIALLHQTLRKSEYFYKLDQNIVQDGEKPPQICKSCSAEGHLKRDCPDETVPDIKAVRLPSDLTYRIMDDVMCTNFGIEALDDDDVKLREKITLEVYMALEEAFPDLDLTMFGSTYNGFGLHMSDVDICLQFKDKPINKATITQEEINNLLTTIVERLKSFGCMQDILAIPSAKVPIVKFVHRGSHLEGDISLSNILALHNTKMLRAYCAVDPRVKVLGCFLKRVTKLCDISDASKGSLSSYGFVLMLIHFLQQHDPPVLPVLQELPPQGVVMVEGYNCWFFDDLANLGKVWPHLRRNKESCSHLWLAFLRYYTEIFNFEEHIVQISQSQCLTRFGKLWLTDTLIAIEDPFDKTHNLGAGLSRRMGVYIVKSFQRFRESFHMSVDHIKTNDWMSFFLNPRRIRGNFNPPVDRQCRICNRIGHFARNCTYSQKTDDRSLSYSDMDEGLDGNKFDDEFEFSSPRVEQRGLPENQDNSHRSVNSNSNSNRSQLGQMTDSGRSNEGSENILHHLRHLHERMNYNSNIERSMSQNVQIGDENSIISKFHLPSNNTVIESVGRNLENGQPKDTNLLFENGNFEDNGVIKQIISRTPGLFPVNSLTSDASIGRSRELGTPTYSGFGEPVYSRFAPPPGFVSQPRFADLSLSNSSNLMGKTQNRVFAQATYADLPPMAYPFTNSTILPPPGFNLMPQRGMVPHQPPLTTSNQHLFRNENFHHPHVTHVDIRHYMGNIVRGNHSQTDVVNAAQSNNNFAERGSGSSGSPLFQQTLTELGSQYQSNDIAEMSNSNRVPSQDGYPSFQNQVDMMNKSPVIIMSNGQIVNRSSVANPAANQYLLSHVHHGPVVSAVQTAPFQPRDMPPQYPMHYHPYMTSGFQPQQQPNLHFPFPNPSQMIVGNGNYMIQNNVQSNSEMNGFIPHNSEPPDEDNPSRRE